MTGRRAPLSVAVAVAVALVLAGGGGAVPSAAAAPGAPVAAPLQDVQLQHAQVQLSAVQVRAEAAAEAYNGAQLAADRAGSRSAVAAAAAQQARAGAVTAGAASGAATGRAQRATAAAARAQDTERLAERAVADAQAQLNAVAGAAYRSGGTVVLYASLLGSDPLAFLEAQQLIDRVDRQQKSLVSTLEVARAHAIDDRVFADHVQLAADGQARQAAQADTRAAAAAQQQSELAAGADAATSAAQRALAVAAAAKQHAQLLVVAAQDALGAASASSAQLAAAAGQARRDAATVTGLSGAWLAGGSAGTVAVGWAMRQIGVPYSWGGGNATGPTLGFADGANTVGFDCSGLTLYAWAHAGVQLGHYTGSQWDAAPHIAYGSLQPGDLVFFATDTNDPATIHHVGLYIGGGNMINAPHPGDVVRIASIAGFGGYIGAVRPG